MKSTKPANMKRTTGVGRNLDQTDRGLGFNGQDNGSSQPARAQDYAGNQQAGKTDPNKTFNMGRGPTVGNRGCGDEGPATPPTTMSVPNYRAVMGANDSLNFGSQVRTPGGTRSFEPSATQNYKGNIDSMNVGRGPTRGNSQGPAK
jgi:hypothetical protein